MYYDSMFAAYGISERFLEVITEKFLDFFSARYIHQTDPGRPQICCTMKPRGMMGVERITLTHFDPLFDMQKFDRYDAPECRLRDTPYSEDDADLTYRNAEDSIDFIFCNGHIEKVPTPMILCSDEEKIHEYGEDGWLDDWDRFFEMVQAPEHTPLSKKIGDLLERLKAALSAEKDGYDSDGEFLDIEEKLKKLAKNADPQSMEIIEDILRQLRAYTNQYSRDIVTGEFCAADNSITLYAESIRRICDSNSYSFQHYIAGVLVHELAHALHFYWLCISRRSFSEKDYRRVCRVDLRGKALHYWNYTDTDHSRTVIETIATCIEHRWYTCFSQHDLADSIKKKLQGRHYPGYPYTGAKRCLEPDVFGFSSNITMAVNLLLELSARGWKTAFDIIGRV